MRGRFVWLPLGLCALCAVGVHAAADVAADKLLYVADHVDAFFDALFSRWALTRPLVDVVGLAGRTFFARGVALVWELLADALLLSPLFDYEERAPAVEWKRLRALLRQRPSAMAALRATTTLAVGLAGACAVARMVDGSLRLILRFGSLAHFLAALVLLALLVLFVSRAGFRALEATAAQRRPVLAVPVAFLLGPLCIAALAASPLLAFL